MEQRSVEVNPPVKPHPYPGDEIDNPISWEPSLAFLRYAITAMLVGSAAFFIALRYTAPGEVLRASGSVLVSLLALTGWYLLSRGRIQATIYLLAYGSWIVAAGLSVFTGGIRAPVVMAFPMIILMIGWLISARAALVITGRTLTVILGFVVGESNGLLPRPLPTSPALHGVVQGIFALLSVVLVGRLALSYQNRLKELGRIGNDLVRRTLVSFPRRIHPIDPHLPVNGAESGHWRQPSSIL